MVCCTRARPAALAFLLAGPLVRAERPTLERPASQLALDAVEVGVRGHLARQRAQDYSREAAREGCGSAAAGTPCGDSGAPAPAPVPTAPSPTPDESPSPTPSPGDSGFDLSKSKCYGHTAEGSLVTDEGKTLSGGEFPKGASLEDCKAECSKNPSCMSFTYTAKWKGQCFLKDKRVTKDSPTKWNDNQYMTYYKARCPACSPKDGSQLLSDTCECEGGAVCNAGQRCSAEKACHNKPGDGPVKYGTAWKDLVTGTSCPAATQLTPRTGGPGGTISCESTPNGGRHFKFPAGEFDIDEQVVVPAGTTIEGNANPNDPSDKAKKPEHSTQTFFVATRGVDDKRAHYCGTDRNLRPGQAQKLRIGFLLHSNTVVKNINFQGRDTVRPYDNGSLCGGAAFETPGCVSEGYAKVKGRDYVGRQGCRDRNGNRNDLVTGDGRGVENVVIDSVRLNDLLGDGLHGTQIAVWVAQTKDSSFTRNVKVTNLVSMLTRGDGINFHGDVRDSVVENCHIENTGDDIYAVWGGYKSPTGLVFRNNVGKNAGSARNYFYGVCIAVYGAREVRFTGNKCYDPPMNRKCERGPYCNSCLAFVHDGYFGAVYPNGNRISFSGNEYLDMDGRPISDGRPQVRHTRGSRAHIVS